MFILKKEATFTQPIKFYTPSDGGIQKEETFDATFKIIPQSRINEIREVDLSKINVVPNPYIVSSLFNEDANGNRLRFTRLPSKCTIDIFTINGEHVSTIYHESVNNNADGNEWWDLKNSSGRKVAPGLYIYKVETENGLNKIGKFAIVR